MNLHQTNQNNWKEKISRIFSSRKKFSIAILAVMIITSAAYFTLDQAQGGNFQFLQTDWSTGADTTNKATHSSDQTGWSKFFSKNSSLNTTGGETKITTTQNSFSQTSNSDFASNTNSNTAVFNNSIRLLKPNGASCSTGSECQTNTCTSNLCSAVAGQVAYTTPGTYSWTVPAGVTSISAVTVGSGAPLTGSNNAAGGGLAYVNNITVTPGEVLNINVAANSGTQYAVTRYSSYLKRNTTSLVEATSGWNITGGSPLVGIGGSGGSGNGAWGGPGGAGGYSGNGGAGSYDGESNGNSGSGGGGAGGSGRGGGGGVGIYGQGTSGEASYTTYAGTGAWYYASWKRGNGGGGSGGASGGMGTFENFYDGNGDASTKLIGGNGGNYGGGAATTANANPTAVSGTGAVRIIWPGTTRQFPSTNTGNM